MSHEDWSTTLRAPQKPYRIFVTNRFAAKKKSSTYRLHKTLEKCVVTSINVNLSRCFVSYASISLPFQKDLHDPVKAVRRDQEFTWTMAKLHILIAYTTDSQGSIMTSSQ